MSSAFSPALAKLDESIEAVQLQLDRLQAALPVDEEQFAELLKHTCQDALSVREMIRVENPDADWEDRKSLHQLIGSLEVAAKAKLNRQRAARLSELADELDAGRIRHRLESRTKALSALRTQAAQELRQKAAETGDIAELPGPDVSVWLCWACNLDDNEDATVLEQLRTSFPAVERFTSELEEVYWVQAQTSNKPQESSPAPPASRRPPNGPAPASSPNRVVSITSGRSAPGPKGDVDITAKPGTPTDGFPAAYERASADVKSGRDAGTHWHSTTAAVTNGSSAMRAKALTTQITVCEKCGESYQGEVHVCIPDTPAARAARQVSKANSPRNGQGAVVDGAQQPFSPHESVNATERQRSVPTKDAGSAHPGEQKAAEHPEARDTAEIEFERLRALAEQRPLEPDEDDAPDFGQNAESGDKRMLFAWAGAAAVVLLGVLLALIYHFHHNNAAQAVKPTNQAQAASAAPGQQTNAAKLTPKSWQPVEGAQNKILMTVELCGRGKPGSIECWGYVSNLSDQNSHVSLDRVDVVDAKGNSFSLNTRVQSNFPSGHSFDIPAKSHVKYSVNVPDKEQTAQRLTLYVDLSYPRNLEYTFRDIPVAE